MEKNKRNKIIGLSLGILIVLIIVVSSTYAYWQITKTQQNPNDIVAACLSLDLEDANAAIDLDSAWPISDEEGKNLTGYSFTVTNNCDQEINYIVGLNRVEESNYLQDSSIKLQLDDNSSHVYSELSDVEYADAENTEYTTRESKQVSVESISANGTNTHTIRVWISEDAPVTEQSKRFLGQVFITGGQGIEVPQRTLLASFDYSKTENDNVTINYYNDRVLEIAGTGNMKDSDTEDFITLKLLSEIVSQNSISLTEDEISMLQFDADYLYFLLLDAALSNDTYQFRHLVEDYSRWDSWSKIDADLENFMINYIGVDESEALSKSNIFRTLLSKLSIYSGIKTVVFSDDITRVGTFNFVYSLAENIDFSSSLKEISGQAFLGCKLSNITIPASVEIIHDSAFFGNCGLYDKDYVSFLTLEDTSENPSHLQYIGASAFENNKIKRLIIPSSVTEIGENAFYDNYLSEVIVKRTEEDASTNISFGADWNKSGGGNNSVYATITYNPNYTE